MSKTILITGSTDGIGLETAKKFLSQGHHVVLHGRNFEKMAKVEKELARLGNVESFIADLSSLSEVESFAKAIEQKYQSLDVLINNAGIFKTSSPRTADGFDVRFVVNTLAPYLLTKKLVNLLKSDSRVINLSSAAQAPVNLDALFGKTQLIDYEAYAQSKLATTMWTRYFANQAKESGPLFIAVNPGSLLGSKMVKEGFGVEGKDISIGADILVSLSLDPELVNASGKYFDNDSGQFAPPHSDGLNEQKIEEVVAAIEQILVEQSA